MMPTLPSSVLAIFAHPDDESFCCGGTLAMLAARGVRIELLCLTKGEAGTVAAHLLNGRSVAELRQAELEQACQILGVTGLHFLEYHDSGFHRPSQLPKRLVDQDVFAVAREVVRIIAQTQPDVLLTFDPRGYYGHPDHIATHRIASAAFFSSASLKKPPQHLLYTMPTTAMLERFNIAGFGSFDPAEFALPDPILRFDTTEFLEPKRQAILAHQSQSLHGSGIDRLLPELHNQTSSQVLSEEVFALGGSRTMMPILM